jgi:DNA (cytosine-5)-methyltransferase 1
MRIGSLFTGYGGLDMAAEAVLGGHAVWTSDIDPGACKIIAHRMPDAPNLGDITKVDWIAAEPIDLLDAGWPCQPFSHAGKRLGAADERALWPEVARAVRALRPRYVVLENVAAIASAGELARATADLSTLGYVGQWRCLRAADAGAPHGRARIFILATDADSGRQWHGPGGAENLRKGEPQPQWSIATDTLGGGRDGRAGQLGSGRRAEPAHSGNGTAADARGEGLAFGRVKSDRDERATPERGGSELAADARGEGQQGVGRLQPIGRDPDGRGGADVAWGAYERAAAADADRLGRDGRRLSDEPELGERTEGHGRRRDISPEGRGGVAWGAYEPAIRRWERVLGRPAPAPTEASRRGTQRLSPAFVEWMMGLPAGWVTDVPDLGRNQQLRALGNGVVPQQAAAALRLMLAQAEAAA